MRITVLSVIVAALALLNASSSVFAQSSRTGGSTTSGLFGPTTLGGSTGGGLGMGTGMTTGMGSTAQSGAAASTTSLGQNLGIGNLPTVQAGGQTGFIGQSVNNNAQNFFASGQQAQRSVNFNSLTQLMNQSRQNQFNRQQAQKAGRTSTQAQSQFRVPLRLGFQPQAVQPRTFGPIVSARLTKIPGLSRMGPITASLENQTVVLRGTVASEADRQLAEGLARLEPEVLLVRNELVVVGSATTAEVLPPGSSGSSQP
jgi:hypothetical protein